MEYRSKYTNAVSPLSVVNESITSGLDPNQHYQVPIRVGGTPGNPLGDSLAAPAPAPANPSKKLWIWGLIAIAGIAYLVKSKKIKL